MAGTASAVGEGLSMMATGVCWFMAGSFRRCGRRSKTPFAKLGKLLLSKMRARNLLVNKIWKAAVFLNSKTPVRRL
jgi:hypothetical protein